MQQMSSNKAAASSSSSAEAAGDAKEEFELVYDLNTLKPIIMETLSSAQTAKIKSLADIVLAELDEEYGVAPRTVSPAATSSAPAASDPTSNAAATAVDPVLILFDIDGTLLNSHEVSVAGAVVALSSALQI